MRLLNEFGANVTHTHKCTTGRLIIESNLLATAEAPPGEPRRAHPSANAPRSCFPVSFYVHPCVQCSAELCESQPVERAKVKLSTCIMLPPLHMRDYANIQLLLSSIHLLPSDQALLSSSSRVSVQSHQKAGGAHLSLFTSHRRRIITKTNKTLSIFQ